MSVIVLTCLGFFILLQSPNSPWSRVAPFTDSSVFAYMGRIILNGQIPYLDAFDHKGPLVYFVNALGLMLNNRYGIWLIELLVLLGSMYGAYKISTCVSNALEGTLTVILTFLSLILYLEGGNLTEEYALPFQIVALYLLIRYFYIEKWGRSYSFFIGVTFALTLMLRANLVIGWIPFCLYIFIESIAQKKYKEATSYILLFILGNMVIIVPILLYLYVNGAVTGFIQDYILYNLNYAARNEKVAIWSAIKWFSKEWLVQFVFLSSLLSIFVLHTHKDYNSKKELRMHLLNLVCMFLNFFIVVQPGNEYGHYMICMLPYMILPFSFLFKLLLDKLILNQEMLVASICIIYLATKVVYPLLDVNMNYIIARSSANDAEQVLVTYIGENTNTEDKILIAGNDCWIYNATKRFAPTKYAYQPSPMDERMWQQFWRQVNSNLPELIITKNPECAVVTKLEDKYLLTNQIADYYLYQINQ